MSYNTFANFYDGLTGNVDYPRRAAYFDSVIKKYNPDASILLDLACGTGTLSIELAKLGYDVVGTDASAQMLSEAMQKRPALCTEKTLSAKNHPIRRSKRFCSFVSRWRNWTCMVRLMQRCAHWTASTM